VVCVCGVCGGVCGGVWCVVCVCGVWCECVWCVCVWGVREGEYLSFPNIYRSYIQTLGCMCEREMCDEWFLIRIYPLLFAVM